MSDLFKLLDALQRHVAPEPGHWGVTPMFVKDVDAGHKSIRVTASTKSVDRYGEIVEPAAFTKRMARFLSNPVLVANHKYASPDGQPTVIGHWSDMETTKTGLDGTAHFADTELGSEYWKLYSGKHMRAFSIGFMPYAHEMRQLKIEGRDAIVRVFTDVELLEISAVTIGANHEALAHARGVGAPAGITPEQVRQMIDAALKQAFDTTPGGPMHNLIRDIVDVVRAEPGHVVHDDLADLGAGDQQQPGWLKEFKQEIKKLV